jgi:polyisoprenoid-binding protein YceI
MNKIIFSMLLVFFTSLHLGAQNEVSFKIKNAGFTVNGLFEKFTSNISYNPNDVTKSTFAGTINVASINTDSKKRDEHLRKDDYFDAVKYPSITFASTAVKSTGPNKLAVYGNLTIKKTSKPVIMNVTVSKVNNKHVFNTTLDLNRIDYGVGGKSFILSDKLVIALKITE